MGSLPKNQPHLYKNRGETPNVAHEDTATSSKVCPLQQSRQLAGDTATGFECAGHPNHTHSKPSRGKSCQVGTQERVNFFQCPLQRQDDTHCLVVEDIEKKRALVVCDLTSFSCRLLQRFAAVGENTPQRGTYRIVATAFNTRSTLTRHSQ
jgi:hypothetical protein